MKVKFYGKEIRGVRRHYAWLRRRLQKRGLTQLKVGCKERRVVNTTLHRVSKWIVSLADSSNPIVLDLTGIRRRCKSSKTEKGKRLNRIVSSMPYYRLTEMIE